MGHLPDTLFLLGRQHVGLVFQLPVSVVGCPRQCDTALETVGIIRYHTIECIGRAAHRNVPQQMLDMDVYGLWTTSLTVVA